MDFTQARWFLVKVTNIPKWHCLVREQVSTCSTPLTKAAGLLPEA